MNKASCLSLVSNAILYWNTVEMGETVERRRAESEVIDDEELSHVSLLPFKHVMPNGTYFIDGGKYVILVQEPTVLAIWRLSKP